MIKLTCTWKRNTGMYATGESGYINRIKVAEWEWNVAHAHTDPDATKFIGHIYLPSLKDNRVFGNTETSVREKLEFLIEQWFKEALK